jgi:hypothetical protein
MRLLNGKIWLRVWGVVRGITKTLWRAIHSEDVWREIHISPDKHPEPTLRRFAYLRDRGVRCYLHNLTSPSGRGVSTGMVSLRVHRDDLNKAYHLLKEISN